MIKTSLLNIMLDKKAEAHLEKYLLFLYATRNQFFGNARAVRKVVEKAIKNTDQVVFHTLFVSFCRFVCIALSLYYERKTGEYSLRMKMRSNRVTH